MQLDLVRTLRRKCLIFQLRSAHFGVSRPRRGRPLSVLLNRLKVISRRGEILIYSVASASHLTEIDRPQGDERKRQICGISNNKFQRVSLNGG